MTEQTSPSAPLDVTVMRQVVADTLGRIDYPNGPDDVDRQDRLAQADALIAALPAEGFEIRLICPPCDDPLGHQYDDDRRALLYGFDDWARPGDPCMWCDHSKCSSCPPPRGMPFVAAHALGEETCMAPDCPEPTCKASNEPGSVS